MFNVGNAKTSSEVNPLYTAVAENKFNALTFLLSSSCDPNVPNPANGQTALHVAALVQLFYIILANYTIERLQ